MFFLIVNNLLLMRTVCTYFLIVVDHLQHIYMQINNFKNYNNYNNNNNYIKNHDSNYNNYNNYILFVKVICELKGQFEEIKG